MLMQIYLAVIYRRYMELLNVRECLMYPVPTQSHACTHTHAPVCDEVTQMRVCVCVRACSHHSIHAYHNIYLQSVICSSILGLVCLCVLCQNELDDLSTMALLNKNTAIFLPPSYLPSVLESLTSPHESSNFIYPAHSLSLYLL